MTEHEKVLEMIRLKNRNGLTMQPTRMALLIIDVQKYFVSPEFPFGQVLDQLVTGLASGYFDRVRRNVIPNIQRLLKLFRAEKMPVLFTATGTLTGDGLDLPPWLRSFDQLGKQLLGKPVWPAVNDPSYEIDESISRRAEEPVIHKGSSGPFHLTKLDQILRSSGIDSLIVAGLTTDVCITQAAREAADKGFNVVIAEDACTTLSQQLHDASLQIFAMTFGRVRTTRDICALLTRNIDNDQTTEVLVNAKF
ncbi:cysteine hydrolase [bacterium]|nr:cysteine hydrolase [bacterium]